MALPAVRKSGRVCAGKRSILLADDFEYDETKFEGVDENLVEDVAQFEVDISSNISNLLQNHSNEKKEEPVNLPPSSYRHVASKLKKTVSDDFAGFENQDETLPYLVSPSTLACPVCDKSLSTEEELTLHVMEHESNGSSQLLSCDICGKMLADMASYTRHIKCHTGERPFVCGQCDKSFSDSCSLKRHLKTHEEDRPFSCDICQKSFRDAPSISRHMLTHTDRPRVFQCSVCEKNFTDKSGLKRHERTHSGVRPFQCDVCNKSFLDSCSFKRHQKIHIGIKNHHCPYCKKSFMEKQSLIRHQKTACRLQEFAQQDVQIPTEDDLPSANACHMSDISSELFEDKSQDLISDKDIQESSNSSFPGPTDSISVSNKEVEEKISPSLPMKLLPSLGSLMRKDPRLYEGITEIVDSIDSYEKMLDLCGEGGQEEIDAVLKRDPTPMPDNLLCFECGELLVDGVNFKRGDKIFHPSMTNAFKCVSCEAEEDGANDDDDDDDDGEEEEEDYGEPPVLMPHYNVSEEYAGKEENMFPVSAEGDDIYLNGSEHSMENYKKQLKNADPSTTSDNDKFIYSQSVSVSSNSEHFRLSVIDNFRSQHGQDHHHESNGDGEIVDYNEHDSSLSPVNVMYTHQMNQSASLSSNLPSLEYEADDPNIPSVFPCHLCTKVFASSSFLARHLELHRKSPHKCMVCSKTFTSGPALKRHMRLHTGEKPYSCPVCDKQFRDPSNFSKHKKNCPGAVAVPSPGSVPSSSSDAMNGNASNSLCAVERTENDNTNDLNRNPNMAGGKRKNRRKSSKTIAKNRPQNNENHQLESPVVVTFPGQLQDSAPMLVREEEENLSHSKDHHSPVMAVMPSWDDEDLIDQSPAIDRSVEEENIDPEPNGESLNDGGSIDYIPCEICQKLCESEQHLEMHMNYHNGNPDVTCIECGKSFADAFGLKRHMRLHTGVRPFLCDFCGRGYCDNWSLKKHRGKGCLKAELQVDAASLLPCAKCHRMFCGESFLLEHMKLHKGEMKYECDVCKKGFSEAFNLKKHRRLHMAICAGCGQEFQNMKLLTGHQQDECTASLPTKEETTGSGKSFSCEVCARSYSTKAYLDRHRKIHLDIKPHVCEICHKRFSEAFKLRRHQKSSHSDLKPFACPDCGKCFSSDAALRRHQVSSSCALIKVMGEPVTNESCVCQVCHKEFPKNYMLVRHMTVHSKDRPFSCDVCGRTYKDTSSLKRHQMIHQGVKDFICPVCGKDFYYADSLKRHTSGRCGRKSKTRRRKAASKKGKKRSANAENNNNNNYPQNPRLKADQTEYSVNPHESWKNRLHTNPYSPWPITEHSLKGSSFLVNKNTKVGAGGRWGCVARKHCWRCDVKASSTSVLMAHRRIHQHKEKLFSCGKCFLRFQRKIYWKAHYLGCNCKLTKELRVIPAKMRRKRSSVFHPDPSCIIPDEEDPSAEVDGGIRKRPRRSVPRAHWSWLSQI